jgi:putative glycosyltransferase
MKLSIVTTLYNSAGTIEEFLKRASAAAAKITDSYEIVIVDDGSPDKSLEITLALAAHDPHLKVVELSRNFGHHKALMTGLMHANGDFCFLIDSDLEEAPELLDEFWAKREELGADVVYGFQRARGGSPLRKISGSIAYWVIDKLIPYKIPHNHITVRLMHQDYVRSLVQHREQQTVIGGLWVITGYRQIGIPVDKRARKASTYRFFHRLQAFVDSVTSFSEAPLVFIFYLGLAISVVASVYALSLIARWLVGGIAVAGWLSVMVSLWLLGGLMIFSLGIIGIYLSKIFIETKNRPYTIVRKVHRTAAQQAAGHQEQAARVHQFRGLGDT